MNATVPARAAKTGSPWRAVALPDEHGGWSLTAEPALLGLLIAPSWAGVALAVAAMVAFLTRTPLKLVLVDAWRHRCLPRTRLAAWIAAGEFALLVALALTAGTRAGWSWLAVVAVAAPLVGIELWFDMRSRSRRLVPELCGALGIAGVVAAVVIAGGESTALAIGAWLLLSARSVVTIPFVRTQIQRFRHGDVSTTAAYRAQLLGALVAVSAVIADRRLLAGALGVLAMILVNVWWTRRAPLPVKVLGVTELGLGLGLVALTAAGVQLG